MNARENSRLISFVRPASRTCLAVAGALSLVACGGEGSGSRANGGSSASTWTPATTPADSPVSVNGQLRVEGTDLLNEAGEVVQLKGVSSMWLNYERTGYAENFQALEWMRDNWNLSVIRAAMGVEPGGAYLSQRSRALGQVRRIVQNAVDAGVYVIIDWHDHNAELHEQEAIEFFRMMGEEFGQYPNVLYETYNEPEGTGADLKPWDTMLKPYHEAVLAGLREVDPDNVAILGTGQWSQRVDLAAANPVQGINLMYTVHFYACDHRGQQRAQANAALRMGAPIFVTEWGATLANGGEDGDNDGVGDGGVCEQEANEWHDFMNARNISWAAWKFDDCIDVSCFFRPGTPVTGNWTSEDFNGHGQFVVDRMRE